MDLTNIPIFAKLNDSDIQLVSSHCNQRTFKKNTVVIHEGDKSDTFYAIVEGKVKVFLSDEKGKEVTLNILNAGDYFGELALIDDLERSASVITMEKTVLIQITKDDFASLIKNNSNVAMHLLKDLTLKFRSLAQNVKSLALLDVYGRVAKTLLDNAEEEGSIVITKEKFTQQEIANRVGASREMVARIMKDLEIGGYISIKSKRIIINEKLPSAY